ncbi:MAG: cation diffusion facilitator family transporter [archaeon]
MAEKVFISVLAVIANLFLAIGKILVGIITSSASIFADGINSATDIISSSISFIGIKWAAKPADKRHPYGHGQAEVIAGFLITIIIFISGVWIIIDAIKGILSPSFIELSFIAYLIMGISALVNAAMSQVKIHYGKKHNSASLISDGYHSRIDLLVSLGIFISLFFVKVYSGIDSIIALVVGIYIIVESFKLGKNTTVSLLGKSAGDEKENQIKKILKKNKIKLLDLKTQLLGDKIFSELTIELPSKTKVDQATAINEKLKKELSNKIENLQYISIQIKSHDIESNYYEPPIGLGKGFGWQRGGRMKEDIKEAKGSGPGGYCVCPKGDYKVKHERGIPCATLKCPNHKINLVREVKKNGKT